MSRNFDVKKAPIGDSTFCNDFALRWVSPAERTLDAVVARFALRAQAYALSNGQTYPLSAHYPWG